MAQRMEQTQSQVQVMAPQLRQSLKILQVPTHELRNVILEELQFNPTLEELPTDEASVESNLDEEDLDPNDYEDRWERDYSQSASSKEKDGKREFFINSIVANTTLQEHLLNQLSILDIGELEQKAINYIIGSLDERGFLTQGVAEMSLYTNIPTEVIEAAIKVVQRLEPIGICSKDTRECLMRQLAFLGKTNSLAYEILDKCYNLLLKNRIQDIAKFFKTSNDVAQEALNEIASLDPAPGRRFDYQVAQGIVPDVSIYKGINGEWVVELNNDFIPRLKIASTYKDFLSSKNIKDADKNYLKLKMRSGRFLIQALEQRQKTIERISYALLEAQYDFFEHGPSKLRAITLYSLADKLGLHETTVSRAVANKFIETPFGLFDFRYFFTKGLSDENGESVANTIIKTKIKELIAAEDKLNPYSDQKISELLSNESIKLARRTVAKYRENLGIPPTNLRRKY